MRTIYAISMFILMFVSPSYAQEIDYSKAIDLDNVTIITDSNEIESNSKSTLPVKDIKKEFLDKNFTGNLVQALNSIPGVQSMDIGSGFSKPMIRGMAFNRISVVENGIKQEGQQWGSDHGLEIDAFNIDSVIVHKGPSSLMHGSDAMGGVIEIIKPKAPFEDQVFGQVDLLGKTVNGTLAGSMLLGIKKNTFFSKIRYTEQDFGDYHVPTDSIVYLTQHIPIYNNELKNTAGFERNLNLYTEYRKGKYYFNYNISNVYQKVGFFPGAHGLPDALLVQDDNDSRNIELPYSKVNHLKVTSHQQYTIGTLITSLDLGYQNNHREEWSKFHTHYISQEAPTINPDRELAFFLNTYSSSIKIKKFLFDTLEYTIGTDLQYQNNNIAGYSFLLPKYNRLTAGLFSITKWNLLSNLSISAGIRYDYGNINISPYIDAYLEEYLKEMGYNNDLIEKYKWRSYAVKRNFGDISSSIGIIWMYNKNYLLKFNIGNSFRLPAANELSSNGIHHGAFRHEQGDPSLKSEKGFQTDFEFIYENKKILFSVTPFFSFFSNYIYLKPTGQWSILPHAGQVYKYTGTKAIFFGSEASFNINLFKYLIYTLTGEYTYTYNINELTSLSFSPPASLRNTLTYKLNKLQIYIEVHSIADQNMVAKNEKPTPGANLINLGTIINIPIYNNTISINLSLKNLFNTKYYNHLSFYRQIEVPEPGTNIQLLIKIPLTFKNKHYEN